MSKFAVGEIAILNATPTNPRGIDAGYTVGAHVEILAIPGYVNCPHCGKYNPNSHARYSVISEGLPCAGVPEFALSKLPGSAIHSSTLALFTRTQRNPDDVPEKSFG